MHDTEIAKNTVYWIVVIVLLYSAFMVISGCSSDPNCKKICSPESWPVCHKVCSEDGDDD